MNEKRVQAILAGIILCLALFGWYFQFMMHLTYRMVWAVLAVSTFQLVFFVTSIMVFRVRKWVP